MKLQYLKNIAAVFIGFLLPMLLSRVTDVALESNGIFPTEAYQKLHGFNTPWMNLLALAYRALFFALGGYLAYRIAATNPSKHVHILGILSTLIVLAGNIAIASIPETAKVLPLWFSVVMVCITFPCIWLGGRAARALAKGQ